MSDGTLTRREWIGSSLALGALWAVPRAALAQETLVAATFPGTWSEAHRNILAPAFRKATGASVTQTILLATDQVSKLQAGKGAKPPFDVSILDEGPLLDAIKLDLFEKYPAAKSKNFNDLLPPFRNEWGPAVTMQIVGISYNPKRIKTPPKSWKDLWNPAYKGRVGLTAPNSSLGMVFLVELARLNGGSESDVEPAFKALKSLLPQVGAIGANLGAYATLWQQEQIDIAPYNFNFTQTLRGKGVDIEFVVPESGGPAWRTSMHIVKGAVRPELAFQYIDLHISPEVQAEMHKPPLDVIPTNRKVALTGAITKIARTHEELAKLAFHDWAKINPRRSEWIERFNREIRL